LNDWEGRNDDWACKRLWIENGERVGWDRDRETTGVLEGPNAIATGVLDFIQERVHRLPLGERFRLLWTTLTPMQSCPIHGSRDARFRTSHACGVCTWTGWMGVFERDGVGTSGSSVAVGTTIDLGPHTSALQSHFRFFVMSDETCDCKRYMMGSQHTIPCRHPDVIAEKVTARLNYMGVLLAVSSNWKGDVFSILMTPNRPQSDTCQHEMDQATLRAGFDLRSWVDPHKDVMQEWTITRWKAKTSCPLYGK
jgi:hypothetical protein